MNEKCGHSMDNGFIFKENKQELKEKRDKDPEGSFLGSTISTAKEAIFEWNLYFFLKYETIIH